MLANTVQYALHSLVVPSNALQNTFAGSNKSLLLLLSRTLHHTADAVAYPLLVIRPFLEQTACTLMVNLLASLPCTSTSGLKDMPDAVYLLYAFTSVALILHPLIDRDEWLHVGTSHVLKHRHAAWVHSI